MAEMSLAAARIDAQLTQLEASKRLKISKSTLVSYEKYRTIPDIETAKAIAELYGRSVNEIRWS